MRTVEVYGIFAWGFTQLPSPQPGSEQKCTGHCRATEPAAFLSEGAYLAWSRVWKPLTSSGVVSKSTNFVEK